MTHLNHLLFYLISRLIAIVTKYTHLLYATLEQISAVTMNCVGTTSLECIKA